MDKFVKIIIIILMILTIKEKIDLILQIKKENEKMKNYKRLAEIKEYMANKLRKEDSEINNEVTL